MNKVFLLDCTLRDGGYVNNWSFGYESICSIKNSLIKSGIEILELGFLRDEEPDLHRTAFASIRDVDAIIGEKAKGVIYSAMIEAFNPFPLNKLDVANPNGTDLIRVCIWKRLMTEHIDYCKQVAQKGYRISIQPSRVEQYSTDEFVDLLKRSNELHPFSFYVVDTWGTQSNIQIQKYLELADRYLDLDIKIGYHGHNNKMQALSCAQTALNMNLRHDLCIDSSIMGMGRGAGNLNTEIIMDCINETCNKGYKTEYIIDAYERYIKQFYNENPWGYSLYYYLSSVYGCNPNFATYFIDKKYGVDLFKKMLVGMTEQEKVVFSSDFVEESIKMLR